MKVIFLDIDGVLNTSETYTKAFYASQRTLDYKIEIDKFRLEYLKEIVDKTEAKIVLSSSFRRFFENQNDIILPRTLKGKKVYDLFKQYGITIYDITPTNFNKREDQIKEWLSNKQDIDSFIIIDDEPSMFFDLYDRLIQTSKIRRSQILMNMDDCTGLCEKHIKFAVDMLNSKVKKLK